MCCVYVTVDAFLRLLPPPLCRGVGFVKVIADSSHREKGGGGVEAERERENARRRERGREREG